MPCEKSSGQNCHYYSLLRTLQARRQILNQVSMVETRREKVRGLLRGNGNENLWAAGICEYTEAKSV